MTALLSEATEQVMAERRAKPKDRQPYQCVGECGAELRPWRRTTREFPGTEMEYSASRCVSCWYVMMREQEPENPEYALTPCTSCSDMTRPTREKLRSAPGTIRRAPNGTQCVTCANSTVSKVSDEQTLKSLDTFFAVMRSNANKVRARGWA